jgi:hypothetical protein
VGLQRIRRVVGRADEGDPVRGKDVVDPQRRQLRVRPLPDGVRRVAGLIRLADPEVALELQVRPVVEGVAERVREGRHPGVELLAGRRVARAEALVDPVGPHRPPLVVVAADPDVRQVRELVVRGDLGLRDVAVVVVDRLALRVAVVELAGRVRLQEEVVVDEFFHLEIFLRNSS